VEPACAMQTHAIAVCQVIVSTADCNSCNFLLKSVFDHYEKYLPILLSMILYQELKT